MQTAIEDRLAGQLAGPVANAVAGWTVHGPRRVLKNREVRIAMLLETVERAGGEWGDPELVNVGATVSCQVFGIEDETRQVVDAVREEIYVPTYEVYEDPAAVPPVVLAALSPGVFNVQRGPRETSTVLDVALMKVTYEADFGS